MGLGYLVLREIPIRNFYARSVMFSIVAALLWENYKFNIFTGFIGSKYYLNTPEHFFN